MRRLGIPSSDETLKRAHLLQIRRPRYGRCPEHELGDVGPFCGCYGSQRCPNRDTDERHLSRFCSPADLFSCGRDCPDPSGNERRIAVAARAVACRGPVEAERGPPGLCERLRKCSKRPVGAHPLIAEWWTDHDRGADVLARRGKVEHPEDAGVATVEPKGLH